MQENQSLNPDQSAKELDGCEWKKAHMLNRMDFIFAIVNLLFAIGYVLLTNNKDR